MGKPGGGGQKKQGAVKNKSSTMPCEKAIPPGTRPDGDPSVLARARLGEDPNTRTQLVTLRGRRVPVGASPKPMWRAQVPPGTGPVHTSVISKIKPKKLATGTLTIRRNRFDPRGLRTYKQKKTISAHWSYPRPYSQIAGQSHNSQENGQKARQCGKPYKT